MANNTARTRRRRPGKKSQSQLMRRDRANRASSGKRSRSASQPHRPMMDVESDVTPKSNVQKKLHRRSQSVCDDYLSHIRRTGLDRLTHLVPAEI